jgi:hypothetical protein
MPLVEQLFESAEALAVFVNGRYRVIGIDQGAKKITVAGDISPLLSPTDTFDIVGSTGNDGTYTVDTIACNGTNTEIVTVGAIPDPTADGEVQITPVAQADIVRVSVRDYVYALFYWVP